LYTGREESREYPGGTGEGGFDFVVRDEGSSTTTGGLEPSSSNRLEEPKRVLRNRTGKRERKWGNTELELGRRVLKATGARVTPLKHTHRDTH